MRDIYDKISKVIGEVLLYSKSVTAVRKPIFKDMCAIVTFLDDTGNSKDIVLEYKMLANVYDHKLDKKIVEIIGELNG